MRESLHSENNFDLARANLVRMVTSPISFDFLFFIFFHIVFAFSIFERVDESFSEVSKSCSRNVWKLAKSKYVLSYLEIGKTVGEGRVESRA